MDSWSFFKFSKANDLCMIHSVCIIGKIIKACTRRHNVTRSVNSTRSKVLENLIYAVTPQYLGIWVRHCGGQLPPWGPIAACSWGVWLSQHIHGTLWDQNAAQCSAVTRQPASVLCAHIPLLRLSLIWVLLCPIFASQSLHDTSTKKIHSLV